MKPLTQIAHETIEREFQGREALLAIDGTAGNGHDTLFLARLVGPRGRVWSLDIQAAAIERTAQRLSAEPNDFISRVALHLADHADLLSVVPLEFYCGQIDIVMFNLGYLPGGDRSLTTRTEATLQALDAAQQLLAPGGILSVMAYPGHPGGQTETAAVEQWFQRLPVAGFSDMPSLYNPPATTEGPRIFISRRSGDGPQGPLVGSLG